MSATYSVTTDIPTFRKVLRDVFDRELLMMMSVVTCYHNALKDQSTNPTPTVDIDYTEMCELAADDGITPDEIRRFLETMSSSS